MRFFIFLLCYSIVTGHDPPGCDRIKHFFDRFGNPASAIHQGTSVEWGCATGREDAQEKHLCTSDDVFYLLDPNDNVVDERKCDESSGLASFRFTFTKDILIGYYKVRYNGAIIDRIANKGDQLPALYIICDDRDDMCKKSDEACSLENGFCIITKSGNSACTALTEIVETCRRHLFIGAHVFCPSGAESLCVALQGGYENSWSYVNTRGDCSKLGSTSPPRFFYANIGRLYLEPVELQSEHKEFSIQYTGSHELFHNKPVVCHFKDTDGNSIRNYTTIIENVATFVLDDEIFTESSNIYSVFCRIDWNDTKWTNLDVVWLKNTLVHLGGTVKIDGPNPSNQLECKIEPPLPADFMARFTWTRKGSQKTETGPIITIKEADEYQCTAKIIYRSCSPRREFSIERNSGFQQRQTATSSTSTTSTTTKSSTTTTTTSSSSTTTTASTGGSSGTVASTPGSTSEGQEHSTSTSLTTPEQRESSTSADRSTAGCSTTSAWTSTGQASVEISSSSSSTFSSATEGSTVTATSTAHAITDTSLSTRATSSAYTSEYVSISTDAVSRTTPSIGLTGTSKSAIASTQMPEPSAPSSSAITEESTMGTTTPSSGTQRATSTTPSAKFSSRSSASSGATVPGSSPTLTTMKPAITSTSDHAHGTSPNKETNRPPPPPITTSTATEASSAASIRPIGATESFSGWIYLIVMLLVYARFEMMRLGDQRKVKNEDEVNSESSGAGDRGETDLAPAEDSHAAQECG